MSSTSGNDLRIPLRMGLIAGGASLGLSAIGMVTLFGERELIANVLTLGQVLLLAAPVFLAFLSAGQIGEGKLGSALLSGAITGLIASIPLLILVVSATNLNLRQFLPNVSPALMELLTFGQGILAGSLILVGVFTVAGLATAVINKLPDNVRSPLFSGIIWTLTLGLFSEILSNRLRAFFGSGINQLLFDGEALNPVAALVLFIVITGISALWGQRRENVQQRVNALTPSQQRNVRLASVAFGVILLVILPLILGTYLSEVINNVGIFVLMGLGLNIVVGFAGLLDLGYVAFFAIGAYSMAVLTSSGPIGISNLTFWGALPICVAIAAFAGIMLGLPVLRMRGDYLAIVTLGFGEIIRILALSDMLKPVIGGAQGILQIPKPPFFGMSLVQPEQLYYVILAGCLLAWFVSWRLSESRLGRQWMAMREDEDVAEAMGITLVTTKLLAFGIGAAFSGLSGAIFASKLTSIFPHSFNLLISINVLCLIIVGGMGSLPGVVVGALILVGLPELLREFAEYRLLMYGALLIVMMLQKPEGFWPSAVRRRELYSAEPEIIEEGALINKAGD
jgi:branched-chain amino acid transport system permease protein